MKMIKAYDRNGKIKSELKGETAILATELYAVMKNF